MTILNIIELRCMRCKRVYAFSVLPFAGRDYFSICFLGLFIPNVLAMAHLFATTLETVFSADPPFGFTLRLFVMGDLIESSR